MNIWILDKDPKEIKNPFDTPEIVATLHIGDWNIPSIFESGKQAILDHAHKIDIDEFRERLVNCDISFDCIQFDIIMEVLSQFLQEKLK